MFGWVIGVATAFAQGLAGSDPVGFSPAPAAAFDAPVLVFRVDGALPPTDRVSALALWSSDATPDAAGSVFVVGRAAVADRLALGASFAVHADPAGAGMGDLHLAVPVFHGAWRGVRFGSVPFLDAPLGAQEWRGTAGAGLRVAGTVASGPARLDANLGLRASPGGVLAPGPSALAGLAASVHLGGATALVLEAEARPYFRTVATPLEAVASLHQRQGRAEVTLGGAVGNARAPGGSTGRVFLAVGATHAHPVDQDGDGLIGAADLCPDQAETVDDFEDGDGCPELPASVSVQAVGFLDLPVLDAAVVLDVPATWTEGATFTGRVTHPAYAPFDVPPMPLFPGRSKLTVPLTPLPGQILFTAEDGLGKPIDAEVSFSPPTVPSFEVGRDGRETVRVEPGQYTVFARAPGKAIERRQVFVGPAEPLELGFVLHDELLRFDGGALTHPEEAFFEPGSEVLKDEGKPLLDQIANYLVENPDLARIEVQVHGAGAGAEAMHLSQRRANNVAAHLYGRGVAWARLVPKGYGGTVPLVPGGPTAAPVGDRRVSFVVLEVAAPPE